MKQKIAILLLVTVLLSVAFVANVNATTVSVVATNPAPIIAGSYADITIQIQKGSVIGQEPVENISFFVKETENIIPVPNQVLRISQAFQGQIFTRTFRVFFATTIPPGEVPITIIEQRDGLSIERTDTVLVQGARIPSTIAIGALRSTPSRLLADSKDNILSISLQNLGDFDAELVTAKIESSYITESFFNSLQQNIPSLPASTTTQVDFDFDIVKTTNEVLPATLHLRYRVRNAFDTGFEIKEKSIPFTIQLARTPQFEIVSQTPRNQVRVGEKNAELLVVITNTNIREGESVRLRIFPDPSAPFDFDRTNYFVTPRLIQNETKQINIKFDTLRDALIQDYVIRAEIESMIGRSRFTQEVLLTIPVTRSARSPIQRYAVFIIIILISVASLIGWKSFKK